MGKDSKTYAAADTGTWQGFRRRGNPKAVAGTRLYWCL